MVWQTEKTFENTERAPAEGRRFVRETMNARGLAGLGDATLLAVSELMTNAVTHGRGRIGLTVRGTDDGIRVAVADEGDSRPVTRRPDPEHRTSGGWGLHLVASVADDWGIDTDGNGTVVWFELGTDTQPGGG